MQTNYINVSTVGQFFTLFKTTTCFGLNVWKRVLGQQIESDELAVMGGTGKKEGWDAARKALGQTKGGVVELHNVTALNQALGVAADWGDYAYFFARTCTRHPCLLIHWRISHADTWPGSNS